MVIKVLLLLIALGLIGTAVVVRNTTPSTVDRSLTEDSRVEEDDEIIKNPTTIEIPRLKLTTTIEHVGLLANKGMDVPKKYENVAWYKGGYYVGERGNAVISGHVDTPQGQRAVFADLSQVQVGDFVIVRAEGESMFFKVYEKQVFPASAFPLEQVFGQTADRNLNLITCEGTMVDGVYPDRLVIFTKKV